jgi:hypothetical protein
MNRISALAVLVGLCPLATITGTARSMCFCVPPPDAAVRSFGQLNFVVIDRVNERTRVVPNIRIVGDPTDFALVVPTPRVPTLSPADAEIWDDLRRLTAPDQRSELDGLDCFGNAPPVDSDHSGDVEVIVRQTVGSFDAAILSAGDADALAAWLTDNGYPLDATELALLGPYVEAGWFFSAMKLADGIEIPASGWDTNVDPVLIEYSGTEVEIPLPLYRINVARLPVTFYVVDDHRVTIDGFVTRYANTLSDAEVSAVRESYPAIGAFLDAGRVLTRLDANFGEEDLSQSVWIERAPTDEEVRSYASSAGGRGGVSTDVVLLATPFLVWPIVWLRRGRNGRRCVR